MIDHPQNGNYTPNNINIFDFIKNQEAQDE